MDERTKDRKGVTTRATFIDFPVPGEVIPAGTHAQQLAAAVVSATERDLMACRDHVDTKTLELVQLETRERELLEIANAVRVIHGLLVIEDRKRSVLLERFK